jgi:hypothetical protein
MFRTDLVKPVDQPDERADMLLALIEELLGGLGWTSRGRTATVCHDEPSLRTED